MKAIVTIPCRWCGRACRLRRGGSPRVFCGPTCRTAFHTGARRWAERAVECGVLTVRDLQNGDPAACTVAGDAKSPAGGEAAELLDELLGVFFDDAFPGELLDELLAELPDAVFERLIAYPNEPAT